jgi:outer membrane protein OmpA-like peptidoglycan-associated protein
MKNLMRHVFVAAGAMFAAVALLLAPFVQASEAQAPGRDPLPAQAGDFALKVEPGVAFPLAHPQSQIFDVGGGATIKALFTLTGYLDIGPSATFMSLPAHASGGDSGNAWAFGGSLRLKRPHEAPDNDTFYAISPWVDADVLYVRTGDLNRPGFAVAAGLAVPIGASRVFWLGPFVRYFQIFQHNRTDFDNRDAEILSVGLSLEVGSGVRREREAAEVRTITKEVFLCPDRDNDGIPDNIDHCPDVAGPMDNWGCPVYKKLVITKEKLELKEKIQFAWNKAILEDVSLPLLDEVVQALKDNKGFRVQIEGNASSEGGDEHNQTLSEQRAAAVLDYLAAHGIAKERLVSKGFGSSVPIETNTTAAGRVANRRVEFVVYFIILNEGSK